MSKVPEFLPTLSQGSHNRTSGKACVMEYVSVIAGEEWSDHPSCTIGPIAFLARTVNDVIYEQHRHLLIPLIPRLLVANVPDRHERARLGMALTHYAGRRLWEIIRPFDGAYDGSYDHHPTDGITSAIVSNRTNMSNGNPTAQVQVLVDMLDEFDRLTGRDVAAELPKGQMSAAVAAVEGAKAEPHPNEAKFQSIYIKAISLMPIGFSSLSTEKPITEYHPVGYTLDGATVTFK